MSNEIRDNIIKFRKRLGYNQSDVARLLGINRSTYAYKESHNSFSPDQLVRLSEVLDVTLDDILKSEQHGLLFESITPPKPQKLHDSVDEPFKKEPELKLNPTEKLLIKTYRGLSKGNQDKALDYVNKLFHEI